MKTRKYRRHLFLILATSSALMFGCGGDDDPAGSGNNDKSNNSNNLNNVNNSNNVNNTNNVNNVNNTNNVNNVNNTNNVNNVNNISGTVSFVQPAMTVYTNGELTVEIAVTGDAENVELVLGDETLTTFDGTTQYTWDTSTVDEGSYELELHYMLAADSLISDEIRKVFVDRTPPGITGTTPVAGATDVPSDQVISIVFDEALDPAIVDATTVTLEFSGGQSTDHTVELSPDGTTLTVDFDRTTIALPYDVTITLDGLADLAGNAMSDGLSFVVPAWRGEELPAAVILNKLEFHTLGGSEYLIGVQPAPGTDSVVVYKNDGTGNWTEVASESIGKTYDIAMDTTTDMLHVAVLRQDTFLNGTIKSAQLMTFDPATDTFSQEGKAVIGDDSDDGAIALDVREYPNQTWFAIATVSEGQLRLFKFLEGAIIGQTTILPVDDYAFVRDESLAVHLRDDVKAEAIFARCSSGSSPCVRTFLERVRQTNNGWSEIGSASTPFHASANTCDEFVNFEAKYLGDTPTLLFSYRAPCSAPESRVRNLIGTDAGWDNFFGGNIFDSMPDPDDEEHSAHVAFGPNDQVYGLMASDVRLMVLRYGQDVVAWLPEAAEPVTTSPTIQSQQFRHARLFMTQDQTPVVVFRIGFFTQVWRAN